LPTLRGFCGDKIVGIRVTALALCYVATRDKSFLDTLARILLRKYCKYHDRYVALHTLDYYLSISADDGVATMFKSILKATPRAQGLAKDIKKRLHEWGHKERHSRDRNA
jgi:hypothetical protein